MSEVKVVVGVGPLSWRPAGTHVGSRYRAEDVGVEYEFDGTFWVPVAPLVDEIYLPTDEGAMPEPTVIPDEAPAPDEAAPTKGKRKR